MSHDPPSSSPSPVQRGRVAVDWRNPRGEHSVRVRELCTPPFYVFLIGVFVMDLSTFVWLFLVLLVVTVAAICLIERHEKRCVKRRDTDELRWTRVEAGEIL